MSAAGAAPAPRRWPGASRLAVRIYLFSLASPAHPTLLGKSLVPEANGGLHTGTFATINNRRYVFAAAAPFVLWIAS